MVQTHSWIYVFCRIRGHNITKCPQINSEVRDGFVRHVGQHMLDIDSKQPQMKEQVHNSLENKLQKINLNEM